MTTLEYIAQLEIQVQEQIAFLPANRQKLEDLEIKEAVANLDGDVDAIIYFYQTWLGRYLK